MDFSSVNDFLKKASSAKNSDRKAIDDALGPMLDDPGTIGVSVELADVIDDYYEKYGDEAFKQIGMFCLGRWINVHAELIDNYKNTDSWSEAMVATADMARISSVLHILGSIGSFGGDEDWRNMLRAIITQTVIEKMEESGESLYNIMSTFNDD